MTIFMLLSTQVAMYLYQAILILTMNHLFSDLQSQCRGEIMMTLEKIVKGLGSAGQNSYKDVYKACKAAMTDRAMAVRTGAAKVGTTYCILE